jgi:hypothetical protein
MWETIVTSRDQSRPVYAYKVTYASGPDIRFTSAEQPLTLDGEVYERYPVKHGRIVASGSLDNSELEIETSFNNPLVELFRTATPESVVNLTVIRAELSASGHIPIWNGRITSFARKGARVTFNCEPVSTQMRRPGLRRTYQLNCPHELYGPQCKADINAFTYEATIAAINGKTLTLVDGWKPANRDIYHFVGGVLRAGNIRRQINWVLNNNQIILDDVALDLHVNGEVALALGCGRNMWFCRNVFNNIANYGGQPWIPLDNPLGGINNFH